jgi:hypothetical protein
MLKDLLRFPISARESSRHRMILHADMLLTDRNSLRHQASRYPCPPIVFTLTSNEANA